MSYRPLARLISPAQRTARTRLYTVRGARIAHASHPFTPSLHSCAAKTISGAACRGMGTGSSAARGFEGVAPAKRQQAAPPPRRYADPARYDWIPVEGDPDPADVASASEAPPASRRRTMTRRRRPGGRTPFPSRASRSTPSSRATTPRRPSRWLPRPRRAHRASRGAPAATGGR